MVKLGKRVISFLLVLVMLLGIVPLNALADDYKFKVTVFGTLKVYLYNDFNDAWDKVTDKGGTIEVRTDVKLSGAKEVPSDTEVTLVATGQTINRGLSATNSKNSGEHFVVRKNATLTIIGGTITGGNNKNGGGAIHVQENAGLILEGVTVTENYSTDNLGGAIRLQGDNSYLTMDANTVISNNHALQCVEEDAEFWGGGGICVAGDDCTVTGDNTLITENTSLYHGGGICITGTNCIIKSLNIKSNTATQNGGGIFIREEAPNASISDCQIAGNSAYQGGGIYVDCTGSDLMDSVVTANTSTDLGGGILIDGGDYLELAGKLSVYGNTGNHSTEAWDDNLYLFEKKVEDSVIPLYGSIVNEPTGTMIDGEMVHIGFDPNCLLLSTGYFLFDLSYGAGVYYCDYFEVDIPGWITFWASGVTDEYTYSSRKLVATNAPDKIPIQLTYTHVPAFNRYEQAEEYYEDTRYPIQQGLFTFRGTTGEDLDAIYYYSDGYFSEDPKTYNTHLATMSMAMAMAAMNSWDDASSVKEDMDEYQNKAHNIYQLLSDLGFKPGNIYISDSYTQAPTSDSIAAAIGAKELKVTNDDGEPYILLSISVRGAGYEAEWASNMTLGSDAGTEAKGFAEAASQVEAYLDEFLASDTSIDLWDAIFDGRVKFWVTGFSRGGATANLLAKRLVEKYTVYSDNISSIIEPLDNQVYAYTFAAPRGGVIDACVMPGTGETITYPTIHNVVNNTDLVAYFYPWQMGFMRYGSDHYMPGSAAGEMQEITNTFIHEEWDAAYAWEDKTTIDYPAYQDNQPYPTNSDAYKYRIGMMVQHLASMNPDIRFSDYFRFANVEYLDNALSDGAFLQECDTSPIWYATAADWFEFFAQHLLEWGFSKNYVDGEIIDDYKHNFRDYFTKENDFLGGNIEFPTAEAALRTIVPHIITLSSNDEFLEAMSYRLSQISSFDKALLYYDGVMFFHECTDGELLALMDLVCDTFTDDLTREIYSEELGAYIQEDVPGLDDFIPSLTVSEIRDALMTLTYVGLRFVNEDWWWSRWDDANTAQQDTYLPGANDSQLHLGTLLYNMDNLMMNHYPEVYMAWLRTDDTYFSNPSGGVNLNSVIDFDMIDHSVQTVDQVTVSVNDEVADTTKSYSGKLKIALTLPDSVLTSSEKNNRGNMIYYKVTTDNQSSDGWQLYNGTFNVTDYETTSLTLEYMLMRFGLCSEVETVTLNMTPLAKYPLEITDNITWTSTHFEAIGGQPFTVTATTDYKIWKWGVRYDRHDPFVDLDPQPENLKQFQITAPNQFCQYITYYYLPVDFIDISGIKPVAGEPLAAADPSLYYTAFFREKLGKDAVTVETLWYDRADLNTVLPADTVAEEGKEYSVRVFIRCNEEASANLFQIMGHCSVNVTGAKTLVTNISDDGMEIDIQCQFNAATDPVYSDITVNTYDLNLNAPTTTAGQLPEGFNLRYAEGDLVSVPAPVFENMQFAQWEVSSNVSSLNQELDLTQSTLTFTMPESDVTLTAQYVPILRQVEVEIPELVVGQPLPTAATSISATVSNTYKLNPDGLTIKWLSHDAGTIVEEGVVYSAQITYSLYKPELEDGTVLSGNVFFNDSTKVYINGKSSTVGGDPMLWMISYWHVTADAEDVVISRVHRPDTITVKRDENGNLPETIQLPEAVAVTSNDALLTDVPVEWVFNKEYTTDTLEPQYLVAIGTIQVPENVKLSADVEYSDYDTEKEGIQTYMYVNVDASAYSSAPTAEAAVADDGTVTVTLIPRNLNNTKIYYTLDGTEPTVESTLYEAPFAIEFVDGYSTVKAIAVTGSRQPSAVATFTYTNLEPESTKLVDRWNLVLEDDLLVNFYLNMNDEDTLSITVAGEETTLSTADMQMADDGTYIASVRLAAAQMTEDITLYLHGSKDVPVSYTIREYADVLLQDEAYSQYHPLIKEMLNYGAQAQKYFDYRADDLANENISGVAAEEIPATTKDIVLENSCANIQLYGTSVLYRDKLAMRFYLSGDITGCTVTVGGKNYTPVAKDALHYVEVADILPQDLDQQLTLTVTDANGDTLTLTYGPMNYIVRMNEKGDDTLKGLLKALYNYHLAAKALRQEA